MNLLQIIRHPKHRLTPIKIWTLNQIFLMYHKKSNKNVALK